MKNILIALLLVVFFSGCNLEAAKKENGSFYADGTAYKVTENGVSVSYVNNSTLQVSLTAGNSQTFSSAFRLDLTQINVPIAIDSAAEGVFYIGANSAVQYFPISGSYQITSYKEGSPITRHTEGVFEFTAINQYDNTDTVHITDGYFYLNNY
jgi:PBP1b-binding outer membrane lipoprotein LpoB